MFALRDLPNPIAKYYYVVICFALFCFVLFDDLNFIFCYVVIIPLSLLSPHILRCIGVGGLGALVLIW